MKYISMLNPYSFYYLWNSNEGKKYLECLINNILNTNNHYKLLDFFNNSFNNVKSYIILESNNIIVLIDFNLIKDIYHEDIILMMDFLKIDKKKDIYLINFNNFKGINNITNNIHNIFNNSLYKNEFIFASSILKQEKINKNLTDYLYTMNPDIIKLYKHERKLLLK